MAHQIVSKTEQAAAAKPVGKLPEKIKSGWLKASSAAAALLVFVLVQILPLSGLTREGHGMLATLLGALVLWIARPIPMAYGALIFLVVPWALGYLPPEIVFSGFGGQTFWMLFAVLGMASCISASPLPKRVFLTVFARIGSPTYKKVIAVSFGLLFILGYFIPVSIAKAAILYAILMPMVPLFGVTAKSRIGISFAVAIPIVAWSTVALTPTAHSVTSIAYGLLLEQGFEISFLKWASITIIPTILVFLCYFLFVLLYARPEANEAVGGREKIQEEYRSLPAIKGSEIWVLVVTLGIMAGWLAGLNTALVAMVGVLLYIVPGIGVMSFSDFLKKAIDWEMLLMIGAFFAMGPMLAAVGLSEIFTKALMLPFSFATTPLLFVLALALLSTMGWGLMIMMPALPLVIPIIMTVAPAAGVNPVFGAILLPVFAPQFLFWIMPPTFALSMKDSIGNLKEWIIFSTAFFLILLVVWSIWVLIQPLIGLAVV